MGASAATQCAADLREDRISCAEGLRDAADKLGKCQMPMPPRCDVLEECILDKPVGLTDQECLEVRLVQAVIRGDVADVQQALKQGAHVNTTAGLSINMGDVVSYPMRQTTPLMRACALGHTDVVDVLLQARADHWRHDSKGWTPLCHALGAGEFDIARTLLERSRTAVERQKLTAQKLQKELLELCEESAGPDAAAALKKEFAPGGLLAKDLRKV
uniref:Uncharacterized protein n=1 Tax=Zooxanthella nutricula TaxID=1333877 RepID=A0A7S2J6K4_9DINO